jgi:hypothetical protein
VHHFTNPIICFMNGIGDSIINLPALRAVTATFKDRVTLISSDHPYVHVFAELSLKEWIRVSEKLVEGKGRLFDVAEVLERLPGECDLFASLNPWHSESVGTLLGGLRPMWSVGFHRDFNECLPLDYNKHSALLAFDVANRIAPTECISDYLTPIRFEERTANAVADILAMFPQGTKILAVHNDTLLAKCWVVERLCQVIETFLRRHPEYVCFTFGGAQLPLDDSSVSGRIFQPRCLLLPFAQCMVAHADLFVGVDSCMLHVADFSHVPSVGLFGPTDPQEFGFIVAPNVTLRGARMEDIRTMTVLEAMEDMCSATS